MSNNGNASLAQALNTADLDTVAGGQQVFLHEFPGAVNQATGLRSFEPTFAAAVADAILPESTKK